MVISSRASCQIVEEQHINVINYIPPCNIWQKEICASPGLTFVHGNHSHVQQPIMINVSHHPAATTRIAADGNCLFRTEYVTCYNRISRISSRTASLFSCDIDFPVTPELHLKDQSYGRRNFHACVQ